MGSLRQDLAPFYPAADNSIGVRNNLPQDPYEEEDWDSEEDDDAMILGTTPHVRSEP